MPIPILLDTDIGTDIDDAYALVLAATAPELDLRAVTVVNHDVFTRARIAKTLLNLLNHPAPVALGSSVPLQATERRGWEGHEGRGIDLRGVTLLRDAHPLGAPELIATLAERCADGGEPLTVVGIGPLTNLALALALYPERTRRLGRVVCMAANFGGFGPEHAAWEHNVACDPLATEMVLRAGLPLTLVSFNVTERTSMTREDVEALRLTGGALAKTLYGMHDIWFEEVIGGRQASAMHDPLAVVAVFRPELLSLQAMRVAVLLGAARPGLTVFAPTLEEQGCCVTTDLIVEDFQQLFLTRIFAAVQGKQDSG